VPVQVPVPVPVQVLVLAPVLVPVPVLGQVLEQALVPAWRKRQSGALSATTEPDSQKVNFSFYPFSFLLSEI